MLADLRLQGIVIQHFKLEPWRLTVMDLKTFPVFPDWSDNVILVLFPTA